MAVSADCRISLSAPCRLSELKGLVGRKWRFCNGELMGQKLKLPQGNATTSYTKNIKQRISMSLTADVTSESKVKLFLPSLSYSSSSPNNKQKWNWIIA